MTTQEEEILRQRLAGQHGFSAMALNDLFHGINVSDSDRLVDRVNRYQVATDEALAKTPPPPAVDLQPIKSLVENWWNWTILDFAAAIGKPIPEGELADNWMVQKFDAFQTAAMALRQFDDETLTILCTKRPKPKR